MRVAFLVNWREGAGSGIYNKVADQAAAWERLGHDVGLFVSTEAGAVEDWQRLPATRFVASRTGSPLSKLLARERAVRRADEWGPDVGYVRHGLVYPGLLRFARRYPLVVEVNGDDLAELAHVAPRQRAVARLTRGALLRSAAGVVYVTDELSRRPAFSRYGVPGTVVANGIDLASFEQLPRRTDGPLTFALVGNPGTPWHGVDQVAELARARPSWVFHVVGPTEGELGGPAPANVQLHGVMDREQLHALLAEVDVGLGTLALHRKGLQEASALKVREYLALGLPVVIGNTDTDFPRGADFLLTVPNEPGGLLSRADDVEAFARRWRGRAVSRAAVASLDTRLKETARLEFLKARVARSSGRAVTR